MGIALPPAVAGVPRQLGLLLDGGGGLLEVVKCKKKKCMEREQQGMRLVFARAMSQLTQGLVYFFLL